MIKKIFLILLFIILLLPVYFMFTGSFQDIKGVMKMPPQLIPNKMTLFNYIKIFQLPWIIWLKNTILVTTVISFLSVFVSISSGYVFSFYRFRFKKILFSILLFGIMIPRIALIIPTYVILNKIHLSGSLLAVILPMIFSPVGFYLAKNYFDTIPISLLESARLDGANEFQIMVKIVSPLSLPIISALLVFSSIGSLQDFLWQALVLQIENRQTLLVGLMRFSMIRGAGDMSLNPIGRSLAVGVILLIPLLIIFIVANKYFISSMDGAIKE